MALKRLSVIFSSLFIIFLFFVIPNSADAVTISPVRFDDVVFVPGEDINGKITVYNEENRPQKFTLEVLNFVAEDETGSPKFLSLEESRVGLASWISFPFDEINLSADEIGEMPFKISVPSDAEPGGYYAVVFLVSESGDGSNRDQIKQKMRIGSLILGEVPGLINNNITLENFRLKEDGKIFSLRPKSFSVLLKNGGKTHLRPDIKVLIKNIFGMNSNVVDLNWEGNYVLPGSSREIDGDWRYSDPKSFFSKLVTEFKEFSFGRYKAVLVIDDIVKIEDENEIVFWIIPWHLVLVVLIIAVLLVILIKIYNKRIIKKKRKKENSDEV